MRMNLMASIQGSGLAKLKKTASTESIESETSVQKPLEQSVAAAVAKPSPPGLNLAEAIKSKSAMVTKLTAETISYA